MFFSPHLSYINTVFYAASLPGSSVSAMEELDASSTEEGFISSRLTQIKRWFLSHAQYLNFFTILVLASVSSFIYFILVLFGCNLDLVFNTASFLYLQGVN